MESIPQAVPEKHQLDDNKIVPFERADAVADRLVEVARANQEKLVKP
jgi:hypothetical protein